MNLFSHLEMVFIFFLHPAITRFGEHIPVCCQRDPTHTLPQPHTELPNSHAFLFSWGFTIQVSFRKSASEGRSSKAEVYFNFGCLFYVLNTCGMCNGHILGFASLSSRLCWLWIRSWNVEKTFSEPSGRLHHCFFDLRSRSDSWESISVESR